MRFISDFISVWLVPLSFLFLYPQRCKNQAFITSIFQQILLSVVCCTGLPFKSLRFDAENSQLHVHPENVLGSEMHLVSWRSHFSLDKVHCWLTVNIAASVSMLIIRNLFCVHSPIRLFCLTTRYMYSIHHLMSYSFDHVVSFCDHVISCDHMLLYNKHFVP